MTPAAEAEVLARELRAACSRCRALGPSGRRAALRLWLAHRLRGRGAAEVRELLGRLAEGLGTGAAGKGAPGRAAAALLDFGRAYHGAAWDALPDGEREEFAASALAELAARVRALTGRGEGPLRAALTELEARASGLDGAVRRAAQESFDRLLESLSPRAVEASTGRGGVRLGAFRKADLYENWAAKHGQLEAYHRAGRLVGDFRTLLYRHLKADAKEREDR